MYHCTIINSHKSKILRNRYENFKNYVNFEKGFNAKFLNGLNLKLRKFFD